MSEKRFICNIIRGSRQVIITDCHTCKSATIDVYDDDFKYFVDLLNKLYEENEQLRQQHQRLYNYFRDYLEDEMSAENFGEMWDNVKEDERWNDE